MDHAEQRPQHSQAIFRAIAFGVLIAAFGAAGIFLYIREKSMSSEEKPTFQEKLEAASERVLAQNTVHKFMTARLKKNETEALGYLTERAVAMIEDKERSKIALTDDFTRYEIARMEELEEGGFRFVVKVYRGGIFSVELLTVRKTLDAYFIDSIERAGSHT